MKRSGFSMIELVFVIVILGVLAAVAVPRFVATRTDAQIATARSDLASAMKAVVAKIFADDIDPTASSAPNPNRKASDAMAANDTLSWGEWIVNVAGLDGARWAVGGRTVLQGVGNVGLTIRNNQTDQIQPLGNVTVTQQGQTQGKSGKGGCGGILGIATKGIMVFAPNSLDDTRGAFCTGLRNSYKNSLGAGNRIIPLGASETLTF